MDYENIVTENPQAVSEPAAPAAPDTSKILGKVSMLLGFTSLGTYLLGIGTVLSLPSAVASLICGFVTKDYAPNNRINGRAKIGIACSLIQIIMSLLSALVAYVILFLFLAMYFMTIFAILAESGAFYYYYY